jgi:hypothetical protein
MAVEMHLPQKELMVEAPTNQGAAAMMAGGLLGFLIAEGIASASERKDEQRAGSIRDVLVDADVNRYFLEAIESSLAPGRLADGLEFHAFADSRAARLSRGELDTRSRVLELDLAYALSSDFRVLRVLVDATLRPRVVKGERREQTRIKPYVFRVEYRVALPGGSRGLNQSERAHRWASLGQQALLELLQEGMREAAALLAHEASLLGTEVEEEGERVRHKFAGPWDVSGRLIQRRDAVDWVRQGGGPVAVRH